MRVLIAALLMSGGLAPLHFTRAGGWHTGTGKAQRCVGVPASRCTQAASWASTNGWQGTAVKTASALGADGIVISAIVVNEYPVRATRRTAWPVRIDPGKVTGGMEGVPARIGVYQLFAEIGNGHELNLTVYFGRGRPTTEQLARADARLAAARLSVGG